MQPLARGTGLPAHRAKTDWGRCMQPGISVVTISPNRQVIINRLVSVGVMGSVLVLWVAEVSSPVLPFLVFGLLVFIYSRPLLLSACLLRTPSNGCNGYETPFRGGRKHGLFKELPCSCLFRVNNIPKTRLTDVRRSIFCRSVFRSTMTWGRCVQQTGSAAD